LEHGFYGLFEGHVCGVDFDGIVGTGEWANGASLVSLVSLEDLLQDLLEFLTLSGKRTVIPAKAGAM